MLKFVVRWLENGEIKSFRVVSEDVAVNVVKRCIANGYHTWWELVP